MEDKVIISLDRYEHMKKADDILDEIRNAIIVKYGERIGMGTLRSVTLGITERDLKRFLNKLAGDEITSKYEDLDVEIIKGD